MGRKQDFEKILEYYGIESQLEKMMEELAELSDAILSYLIPGTECKACAERDLIDEMADVAVLFEQLAIYLGAEEIVDRADFKIKRQLKRIARELDETIERDLMDLVADAIGKREADDGCKE